MEVTLVFGLDFNLVARAMLVRLFVESNLSNLVHDTVQRLENLAYLRIVHSEVANLS